MSGGNSPHFKVVMSYIGRRGWREWGGGLKQRIRGYGGEGGGEKESDEI